MQYFLEKPLDELKGILSKLNRTHEECNCYEYTECDYIYSQVTNKKEFVACIENAIKLLEEADKFTKMV